MVSASGSFADGEEVTVDSICVGQDGVGARRERSRAETRWEEWQPEPTGQCLWEVMFGGDDEVALTNPPGICEVIKCSGTVSRARGPPQVEPQQ